jgi:excisionase family DNA binding protein
MNATMEHRPDAGERGLERVGKVAEFLKLSRSKVYAMMETGQLPYVKLGKSRRIRWNDVLRLVETNLIARDG